MPWRHAEIAPLPRSPPPPMGVGILVLRFFRGCAPPRWWHFASLDRGRRASRSAHGRYAYRAIARRRGGVASGLVRGGNSRSVASFPAMRNNLRPIHRGARFRRSAFGGAPLAKSPARRAVVFGSISCSRAVFWGHTFGIDVDGLCFKAPMRLNIAWFLCFAITRFRRAGCRFPRRAPDARRRRL